MAKLMGENMIEDSRKDMVRTYVYLGIPLKLIALKSNLTVESLSKWESGEQELDTNSLRNIDKGLSIIADEYLTKWMWMM